MTSAASKYICTLSAESVAKAEKELNEKAKWRERDIQALREMVVAHKGLKCRTDDAFLLRFLRARKFDYDRAYQLIIRYFEVRAQNVDIFKDFRPSTAKPILEDGVVIILPGRSRDGCAVSFFRPGLWNPTKMNIWGVARTFIMCLETLIEDEETQVNGLRLIGDMGTIGWEQAKNVTPSYAKLMTTVIQEAFPTRFKGMHIVNESAIFDAVFAIMRTFMKEKMRNRVVAHGKDYQSLYKLFDPAILPEELGGKLGPAEKLKEEWNKKFLAREPMFEDLLKYNIELDRQIMPKTASEGHLDNTVGTFKKLSVD